MDFLSHPVLTSLHQDLLLSFWSWPFFFTSLAAITCCCHTNPFLTHSLIPQSSGKPYLELCSLRGTCYPGLIMIWVPSNALWEDTVLRMWHRAPAFLPAQHSAKHLRMLGSLCSLSCCRGSYGQQCLVEWNPLMLCGSRDHIPQETPPPPPGNF